MIYGRSWTPAISLPGALVNMLTNYLNRSRSCSPRCSARNSVPNYRIVNYMRLTVN